MIRELNDVSIRTMIGQLPDIINQNNIIIEENFDNIYDSSLNKIIKPVDTTQNNQDGNYVKSHTGNFLNVICDNIIANKITVKDIVVEDNITSEAITNHDSLTNRYKYKSLAKNTVTGFTTTNSELKKYSHNAGAIGVRLGGGTSAEDQEGSQVSDTVKSLQEVLNDIFNKISLYTQYRHYDSVYDYAYDEHGNKIPETYDPETGKPATYVKQWYNRQSAGVHLYGTENNTDNTEQVIEQPNSFTFENNILFASNLQLKRMNLPQYQYNDIKTGNLFTYYDYSPIIIIDDEHTASLNGVYGQRVQIKFKDLKKKAYFRIVLSRKDKKYLRISKDELVRLNLICLSNDDTYGTIWDVDTYCVRNPEDLIIETK